MLVPFSALQILEEFESAFVLLAQADKALDSISVSFFKARCDDALKIADAGNYYNTIGAVFCRSLQRHCATTKQQILAECIASAKNFIQQGRVAEGGVLTRIAENLVERQPANARACSCGDTKKCATTGTSVYNVELRGLHRDFDRTRCLALVLSGHPWMKHGKALEFEVVEADLKTATTRELLLQAQQELLVTLKILAKVDTWDTRGQQPLCYALHEVEQTGQTRFLYDIAVSTIETHDVDRQDTKLYANWLLASMSCCRFALSQAATRVRDSPLHTAIRQLPFYHSKRKSLERRLVTKHALCLLDAFHHLCTLEPQATAVHWLRIQCALFAVCIIHITQSMYHSLELENLREAVFRVREDLLSLGKEELATYVVWNYYPLRSRPRQCDKTRGEIAANQDANKQTRENLYDTLQSYDLASYGQSVISSIPTTMGNSLTMQAYRDITAHMMNRPRRAPHFWHTVVPHLSLHFRCVRDAMLAAADSSKALLLSREGMIDDATTCEVRAIGQANKAICSIRSAVLPIEVLLTTSLLLSWVDLFCGRPNDAIVHVQHASRIAQRSEHAPSVQNEVGEYCQNHTDSLWHINGHEWLNADRARRLACAVASFTLTIAMFDQLQRRVCQACSLEQPQILKLLALAKSEVHSLRARWAERLNNEHGVTQANGMVRVEMLNASPLMMPWYTALKMLKQERGDFDLVEFEITMERTMPFLALNMAGVDRDLREDVATLLMDGPRLRGKMPVPWLKNRI